MSTKTTVAEYVAGNVDVLLEILVRLPAKSLVRFKLVSKQWCSHISDPQFVNSHVRRNPNKSSTGIFLCALSITTNGTKFVPFNALDPSYQTIPSLSFLNSVHPFVSYIKIVQSCNGLLLCTFTVSQPGKTIHYCVFNPTTKLFRLFPELDSPLSPWWPLGEFLAFDPSISPYYKLIVVKLVSKDHKYISQILLYSSENKRWRDFTYPLKLQSKVGVFVNGAIYWPDAEPNFVIVFDVMTEEIIRMPLSSPKPYLGRLTNFCNGTGGRRFFCIDRLDVAAKDFRVLEMCVDKSSKTIKWVTKYEASVSLMQSLFPPEKPPCFGHIHHLPVCVVEGAKEEDLAVVLAIPGEIIWYDIMHETVNPLCELNESFEFGSVFFQFIESLYAV